MSARAAGMSLIAAAIGACNPPEPPLAPIVEVTVAPSTRPQPLNVAAPVPEPTPAPFVPKAPFTIIAEADGDDDFAVFPIERGEAIIAVAKAGNTAASLRLMRVSRDDVFPAPELAKGLPPAVFADRALPLVAGRYPDALWLARGQGACEAYQWDPQRTTWEARPVKAPGAVGPCTHLAAWTPGAAIAVVGPTGSPRFAAFGVAPRRLPVLPTRTPDQPKSCASRAAAIHSLFAFETGELIAVGPSCAAQSTWLARFAKGTSKGDVVDAEVDPNAPYLVRAPSKDEVVIDGAGVLPQSVGEEVSLEVRFQVGASGLRRASIRPHEVNALERWMYEGRALIGAPAEDPRDGFRYEGYALTTTEDVLVVGKIARHGKPVASVLLRNRPVTKPIKNL